jgi:hypothetical protein
LENEEELLSKGTCSSSLDFGAHLSNNRCCCNIYLYPYIFVQARR